MNRSAQTLKANFMDENIQKELEELQNLPEAERDETQQNRFKELTSWAESEKTATEKSKELESALAQKEHFRTKFEKTEAEKKELEIKLGGAGQAQTIPQDPIQVAKLANALKDFNEDETSYIITYAKGKFNTLTPSPEQIIEAAKDGKVQTLIQAEREKVVKEKQVPPPSSPSGSQKVVDAEKLVREGKELEEIKKQAKALEEKEGRIGEGI